MAKTCQICGKPSGMYPLCYNHMRLKNEGKVVKNEKTKRWELVEKAPSKKEEVKSKDVSSDSNNSCIVCGESAPYGPQCIACYSESKEYKQQIDKNSRLQELGSYYYNLHGNIYRMNDFAKVKSNSNKLFAIAQLTKEIHNSNTYMNKIESDIHKIIERKKPKEEKTVSKLDQKQDSQQEKIYSASDGHNVKSLGEKIIDDLLYNNRIVHAYSPTVSEIDITEEQSVEADWFIPIISSAKGIYIEYWGMTTKSYLDNKKRKLEQYKKHKIPVIEIQKDEPFEDSDILRVRIMRELKSLSKEHYKHDWTV
ncbi:TPA: hypothetical protein GXZ34_04780 [bacterium]|nr:hypothetical protein [bacterium]